MTRKEQIKEQLRSYLIWYGDALAIHEDALNNLTDDILALPLDVPGDEEIRGEAMAYSVYPAKPDGYPDFDVERAVIFDEAAIWMRSEILKRNTP